jgi:lipopolysaccharide export system protein LptA
MLKVLILSLTLLNTLFAEEPSKTNSEVKDENLVITSQHLDYSHDKLKAIFTHDVKAINGETIMTSDKMICFFDKNNDPYLIIAEGNVVITRGISVAKAQKSTYLIKEEKIILRTNPELFDGNNTIKGRIITFFEEKRITEIDDADVLFKASINEKKKDDKKEDDKEEVTTPKEK